MTTEKISSNELERAERAERLLLGACRLISRMNKSSEMGPDLLKWWMDHPEYRDERARKAMLEIPPAALAELTAYVAKYHELPTV